MYPPGACGRYVHRCAGVGLLRTSPSATKRAAAPAGLRRSRHVATTRIRFEQKVQNTMTTQIETGEREVVLLENGHIRPMMGLDVLEPLPSRTIPYSRVDPFILVHDTVVPITEQRATLMEVRWCATGSRWPATASSTERPAHGRHLPGQVGRPRWSLLPQEDGGGQIP